jgi:acid phosphatase
MIIKQVKQEKFLSVLIAISFAFIISINQSVAVIPRPNHVVICIMENHDYYQIIGSTSAPYINSLVAQSANLTEYYGLTHPSQPNYLMLFSGGNQGVTSDGTPVGTPWTAPNLGASLINAGFGFRGYSEDLPYIGSNTSSSGNYARKHNPWVNWQGTGVNQIPAGYNLTMNEFPTDYNQLPTLSFVIPNQANDMHDGADPYRITAGDQWVQNHLQSYIAWAQANNSLFILTFDEDDFTPTNHIPWI